ncbi:J domain-containing protein [Roseburia hominis]
MNCYEVLGIEETYEIKRIKKAYAAKSREYHPEDHPEEFQVLHAAYEEAIARAKWEKAKAEVEAAARENENGRDREEVEEAFSKEEASNVEEAGRTFTEQGSNGWESENNSEVEFSSAGKVDWTSSEEAPSASETGEAGPWQEQFERLANAGGQNAGINCLVRRLMEEFHILYMNEEWRSKLYKWRDYFDEPFDNPRMPEVFASREFVEAWYHFLGSHHIFTMQIWQYFASIDGYRFNSEQYGIPRFPYHVYIEQVQSMERAIGWQQESTPVQGENRQQEDEEECVEDTPEQRGYSARKTETERENRKEYGSVIKKKFPGWLKMVLYIAVCVAGAIGGTIFGLIVGLIFG